MTGDHVGDTTSGGLQTLPPCFSLTPPPDGASAWRWQRELAAGRSAFGGSVTIDGCIRTVPVRPEPLRGRSVIESRGSAIRRDAPLRASTRPLASPTGVRPLARRRARSVSPSMRCRSTLGCSRRVSRAEPVRGVDRTVKAGVGRGRAVQRREVVRGSLPARPRPVRDPWRRVVQRPAASASPRRHRRDAGPRGTVYQAFNFRYTGRTKAHSVTLLPDGQVMHGRAMARIRAQHTGHRYAERVLEELGAPRSLATTTPPWLQDSLVPIGAVNLRHPGNHRYCLTAWRAPQRQHLRARSSRTRPTRAARWYQPELTLD